MQRVGIHPPLLAISLDSLIGGLGMAEEEVCQDENNEEQVKKPGVGSTYSRQLEEEKKRSSPSTRSSISWKPEASIASLSV